MDGWVGDARAFGSRVARQIATSYFMVLVYGDDFNADHGGNWRCPSVANDGRLSEYFFDNIWHCLERQSFVGNCCDCRGHSCSAVV